MKPSSFITWALVGVATLGVLNSMKKKEPKLAFEPPPMPEIPKLEFSTPTSTSRIFKSSKDYPELARAAPGKIPPAAPPIEVVAPRAAEAPLVSPKGLGANASSTPLTPAEVEAFTAPAAESRVTGKGCIPCSRDHWASVYGAMEEALRFARREPEGMAHPEVQNRLAFVEKELNVWERIDMSPDKLQALPEGERQEVREWIAEGSRLRQKVAEVTDIDELEKLATKAREIHARARLMALPKELRQKIESLAKKVQTGEMSLGQARGELSG